MREALCLQILEALGGLPVEARRTEGWNESKSYKVFETWYSYRKPTRSYLNHLELTVIRVLSGVERTEGLPGFQTVRFTDQMQELPEYVALGVSLPKITSRSFNAISPAYDYLTHPSDVPGLVHSESGVLVVETSKLPEAVRFLKFRLGLSDEQKEDARP